METIKLQTHVGSDGLLKLELAAGVTNRDVEVEVVIQPLNEEAAGETWAAFVERMYGVLADDPLERPVDVPWATRDEIE